MLKNKGAEVDTLDVYAYISNLIKTTIDKGYLFSSKHMQTLYRLVYQLAENNGASYFSSAPSIINIINALGATKFTRVISDREPDVIICTHVFAAQMVDELKKRKKLADIMTIGIVTDYTLHPYWEDVPRVQYIVTASELLTYRCVQRGVPRPPCGGDGARHRPGYAYHSADGRQHGTRRARKDHRKDRADRHAVPDARRLRQQQENADAR